MDERLELNRQMWDERVPLHVDSTFYDVEGFLRGRNSLESFEIEEVGCVEGKTLLHLQCHFGLDTLSWARLGAQAMGVDFSKPAIEQARRLAEQLGLDAHFKCAELYAVPDILDQQFDIVYTSHGVLNWLPDVERWAQVVTAMLRPGGIFYLSEFHPISDPFAYDTEHGLVAERSYFTKEPTLEEESGTYADLSAATTHNWSYQWTHTLGEIVTALVRAGLQIEFLHERPYTLFPRFSTLERKDDGTYWFAEDRGIPLMFSLRARKPAVVGGAQDTWTPTP